MFICRQCQCREDPGELPKQPSQGFPWTTSTHSCVDESNPRTAGTAAWCTVWPQLHTPAHPPPGFLVFLFSLFLYCLASFFVLFCLVVSWAAGARWLPSFPGPKNFALRLLPTRMHLDRPYVSPGTCACDCSCDWHHRHEKANQNSCKKSSALFKLRLGMPLNVVPVDTTVRSEHTKSMWIARGCT